MCGDCNSRTGRRRRDRVTPAAIGEPFRRQGGTDRAMRAPACPRLVWSAPRVCEGAGRHLLLLCAVVVAGCGGSGSEGGAAGNAGMQGNAGSGGTTMASGGSGGAGKSGSGGMPGSGGVIGSGGVVGSGGVTNSGGGAG